MSIYHLLDKPVRRGEGPKIIWACLCGKEVAMGPQGFPRLTQVRTPDPHGSSEVVECTACFAGQDAAGDEPPSLLSEDDNPVDPTLDAELGTVKPTEEDPNAGTFDTDGETLSEEREEYL